MQQAAVDQLIEVLDLEAIEVNIFRGTSPDEDAQRVFGGQVAGQALVAAARTVDADRHVHSLHAYFLRPGDPTVPILYEVDRIRDGRSFTTRRRRRHPARPGHLQPVGLLPRPRGRASTTRTTRRRTRPSPSRCPTSPPGGARSWASRARDWLDRPRPIDIRHVDWSPQIERQPLPPAQPGLAAGRRALPDDPVLHACVVTYASDMTLLDTTLLPHGRSFIEQDVMMASLDHAMWFHRPFRADEWLLYAQDTPSASGGRGLARGLFFDRPGLWWPRWCRRA